MSHKKYGVHLGLSGPFHLVWLQYSSSDHKTHSPSARACLPNVIACCTSRNSYGKVHTRSQKAHFTPQVNNILLRGESTIVSRYDDSIYPSTFHAKKVLFLHILNEVLWVTREQVTLLNSDDDFELLCVTRVQSLCSLETVSFPLFVQSTILAKFGINRQKNGTRLVKNDLVGPEIMRYLDINTYIYTHTYVHPHIF